jgi:hypothetical protein
MYGWLHPGVVSTAFGIPFFLVPSWFLLLIIGVELAPLRRLPIQQGFRQQDSLHCGVICNEPFQELGLTGEK